MKDLFGAGTETTSSTTEWAMALLLNHLEALNKVRAEIDAVVGSSRLIAPDDVPRLGYLHCVINETLRMYPAARVVRGLQGRWLRRAPRHAADRERVRHPQRPRGVGGPGRVQAGAVRGRKGRGAAADAVRDGAAQVPRGDVRSRCGLSVWCLGH
jgi:hypothetical protein